MFVRPTNPVSHRLARLAFIMACVAALVVAVGRSAAPLCSGSTSRPTSTVFRYGFYLAVAADRAGACHHRADAARRSPARLRRGLARRRDRRRRRLDAARLVPAAPSGRPSINDISTDTANPPPLVVTLQLRRGAPNPPAYPGASAGVLQRAAYPDIVPVILPVPPAEAFKRVDDVAMAMGWDIVARAPAEGRLEAVATSDWFGFQRRHRGAHPCRGRGQPDRHPLQEPRRRIGSRRQCAAHPRVHRAIEGGEVAPATRLGEPKERRPQSSAMLSPAGRE